MISAPTLYLKPEYLLMAASEGKSECGNTISGANFLTLLRSNYGSILCSFRDTTM